VGWTQPSGVGILPTACARPPSFVTTSDIYIEGLLAYLVLQTFSEKPLTDLALLADGATALCSSTDRMVSVIDLRASTSTSTPASTFSHPAMPSTLAAHPTDGHRAMSGAYDGIVRVWDLRSTKAAVAGFKCEKGRKVLSVDWGKGIGALGGEDGIEVWKIGEGGEKVQ
jgi:ribosome biogenesis protein